MIPCLHTLDHIVHDSVYLFIELPINNNSVIGPYLITVIVAHKNLLTVMSLCDNDFVLTQ